MALSPTTAAAGEGDTGRQPATTPDVTVVVIAFNERHGIVRTVRAVLAQEGPETLEVLVVDDGSTDGTPELLRQTFADEPRVRVWVSPENRGRGAARFEGTRRARGRDIAFVDADIVLPTDWLVRCRAALADADAAGGTATPDGDVAYLYARFGLTPRLVAHSTTVTGSNGLFRGSVFDVVSFDPALRNGEDVAFNEGMTAAGLHGVTVPGLVVEHAETKSFRQSVAWLFESGIGAQRQFARARQVRLPDLTAAGMAGVLAVGTLAAAGSRRPAVAAAAGAAAVTYPLAVAAAHVATRFDLRTTPWAAVGAVGADYVLICAYFAGRAVGVVR